MRVNLDYWHLIRGCVDSPDVATPLESRRRPYF